MYRHGRPDVVCVVSSEFLFLPPPFFAAPTVFLSHPRPFFPRFFLSLFRSPITYLRSSGAQLPLAAPRLHAFDTINEPRQRSEMKPISRFGFRARKKKKKEKRKKKNEVAPTRDQGWDGRLEKRTRTQRRSSGRKKGRRRDVSTEFDRNFPRNLFARTMTGWCFLQQGQINFPTLPFSCLLYIDQV